MFGHDHEKQIQRIEDEVQILAAGMRIILERMELMSLDLTKLNAGAAAAEATIAALRTENADLKTQLAAAAAKEENPADQEAVNAAGDALAAAAATPAAAP